MFKKILALLMITSSVITSILPSGTYALDNVESFRGSSDFYWFNDFEVATDTWSERQSVGVFTPQRICSPYSLSKINVTQVPWKIWQAIKPNVVNWASLRASADIKVWTTYTINMWVDFTVANRPVNWNSRWTLAGKNGWTYHHIIINQTTWKIGMYLRADSNSWYDMRALSGWHMLSMVSDGTKNMVYIDGTKVWVDMPNVIDTNVNPIQVFGNYDRTSGNQESMPLDEIAVYNKPLDVNDIGKLYNIWNGVEANKAAVSWLYYYYGMEEQSSSTTVLNGAQNTLGYDGKQGCYMRFPENRGRAFETNGWARFDTNTYRYLTMTYRIPPGSTLNSLVREVNSGGAYLAWRSIQGTILWNAVSYPKVADWNTWGNLIDDNQWHTKTIELPANKFFDALIWHGDDGYIDMTSIWWAAYNAGWTQWEFYIDGMFIHKNISDVSFLYKTNPQAQCDFSDATSAKVIDWVTCDLTGRKISFNNNVILRNWAVLNLWNSAVFEIENNHWIDVDDSSKVVTTNWWILQINNTPTKWVCWVLNWTSTSDLNPKIKALVVAWWGGGWYNAGAGWGAGWVLANDSLPVAVQAYAVTIGLGWNWDTSANTTWVAWWNSVFSTLTAIWGWGWRSSAGAWVAWWNGWGWAAAWAGWAWTTGQWFAWWAGNGQDWALRCWAGWGWGWAVWQNTVSSAVPGNGWIWFLSSITGVATYYAGGWAGSCHQWSAWVGWLGGGWNSPSWTRPSSFNNWTPGTANTWGWGWAWSGWGGNWWRWGDWVVIISYPTGSLTAVGWTITTTGWYTIHTFTTNGTFTVSAFWTAQYCSVGTSNVTDSVWTDWTFDWTCTWDIWSVATSCSATKYTAPVVLTKRVDFVWMSATAPWNWAQSNTATLGADNIYTSVNDGNWRVWNTAPANWVAVAGKTIVWFNWKLKFNARSADCWSDWASVWFFSPGVARPADENIWFSFQNNGSSGWRRLNAGWTCDVKHIVGKYYALNACAWWKYIMMRMKNNNSADTTQKYYQYVYNLNDLVDWQYTFEPGINLETKVFTLKVRNSSNALVKDVTVTNVPLPANNYSQTGNALTLYPRASSYTSCTGPLTSYPSYAEIIYK